MVDEEWHNVRAQESPVPLDNNSNHVTFSLLEHVGEAFNIDYAPLTEHQGFLLF